MELTKKIISFVGKLYEDKWDMGHKPGSEFRKHQKDAAKRGISRKEFLNEHNKMEVSKYQIDLFKELSPILGVDPRVHSYGDQSGNYKIRILTCPDPIDKEVLFLSTIGLSELASENNHTEILAASYIQFEEISNILSSIAFFILKDKWKSYEGFVFETLVEMYYPNIEMKHIYFTSPFLWEDKLEGFSINGININFLLAIPISDNELEYLTKYGKDALEDLFEKKNIDIFDINRKSVW